jgi:hypothetical protein
MNEALLGSWIGDIRGTVIGNGFAMVSTSNAGFNIALTIRSGSEVFELAGILTISGERAFAILATAKPSQVGAEVRIEFDQVEPTKLVGRWHSQLGDAGVIFLSKSDTNALTSRSVAVEAPNELVARSSELPNLKLFRPEIEAVSDKLKELVGGPFDVVISADIDGQEVRQLSKDFFAKSTLPPSVNNMTLSMNDARQPIASTITVNLRPNGTSNYFVQSDNRLWVAGSAAELDAFFARYTNPIGIFFQKHGLNANGILLFVAIALLPDLPLIYRLLLLVSALIFVNLFVVLHKSLSSTKIVLDKSFTRGVFTKATPSIVSGLSVLAITGILGWAYSKATLENLHILANWLGLMP